MKCVVIHWLHITHLMKKNNAIDFEKILPSLKKQAKSIVNFEK